MRTLRTNGIVFSMDNSQNEKKNFLSHFFAIGSGTIINMLVGLITTPIITRIVDPNEYGQLSIFTMYTSITLMFLFFGLDQALVRYYYDEDSNEYRRRLLKLCFFIPLVIGGLFSLIVILVSVFHIFTFEFSTTIMIIMCCNVIVNIWTRISTLVLRTTYQSKKYAISDVLHRLSYIALVIPLIVIIDGYDLEILCIATLLSLIIQGVYTTFATRNLWHFKGISLPSNYKEIIRYGLPLMLSMGLTTLFQAIDKISLNHFCTYSEVGIYTGAMTIISIFAIIQSTFNAVWSPMQTEHYVKHPEDTSFIKKGNRYITVVMFFIGLSLIFCKDFFVLLLGEKYRFAGKIIPFLIFNPIMYTISETTCSGIGVSKKSYLYIYISIVSCITNFAGNWILVPRLGGQGAAISTGISYIVYFALRTAFSNKYYYVDYALKRFMVITAISLLYAWYNTFYEFGLISVVGYIISVIVLLVLYKNDIIEIITIGKRQLLQFVNFKSKRKEK